MFCASGHDFDDTEAAGSCFHFLHVRACFRRNRGRRLPFSCFGFPYSFLMVPRRRSRFHVFISHTRFRRYGGCQVPFSCFARLDSFSAVPREAGPIFMFCAPGHIFGVMEGRQTRFHVLRSRTHFRRYGGRRVPFSCFARPDSFSVEPMASGPVFIFCTP
jgi:hypothetical protein